MKINKVKTAYLEIDRCYSMKNKSLRTLKMQGRYLKMLFKQT